MKKLMSMLFSGVAIVALNGCGGGGSDYYDDGLTTLFLVDEQDFAYGGVPYKCDSMVNWSVTAPNGEFSFYPPDDCIFDFTGLNGVYGDIFDDVVRIVDYTYDGKEGIPYECSSFNVGNINYTDFDGSFVYDIDDACVFYL